MRHLFGTFCLAVALLAAPAALAQPAAADVTLQVAPNPIDLAVGDSMQVDVQVLDASGAVLSDQPISVYSRRRRLLSVTPEGYLKALQPGEATLIVQTIVGGERVRTSVPVRIPFPSIDGIAFAAPPARLYTGTRVPLAVDLVDTAGRSRDNAAVTWTSLAPRVATVDPYGYVTAVAPGPAVIVAEADGVEAELSVPVVANPVARLDLAGGADQARTGDVLDFNAQAYDVDGQLVDDVPVTYTFQAVPDDDLGNGATGQIEHDGRFVAEQPGLYTIAAMSGSQVARHTVRIEPRDVGGRIEFIDQGLVDNVHTSDLWVWEGVDGRDYAVTGTWGGNGDAYFWDVTDPANLTPIDTFTVDARTVNDVKVSEDGTICILSREGASNRRNGIVLLDCTDPSNVSLISTFDDELTGGVHNLFIYDDHVYALSAGQRYDIINIEDPANPRRVGRFELEGPGQAIHDVWVVDGIAYSSNWSDGVVMVDVGNGVQGGSPSNPVEIGRYAYPSGWNHAAFPFYSPSTGKFYIIAGDEAFPYGLYTEDRPTIAAGWLHFIDFTDPENPKEVARYEVPEAGTHNFWVEDETLYVAYYNGGLRVVDLSGDLMGDLYKQGREMARYLPHAPDGYIPNAPMVWGPQPHKGNLFFSDWNSGLWSVKFVGKQELVQPESD